MTVEDTLKVEEGFKPHVYPDSLGYATIGYGFLIDSRRGAGLPKAVADFWLKHNIEQIRDELPKAWQPYLSQPSDVQDALVQMAYQLGVEGVLGFQLMLASLQKNDRESAAINALNSKWAAQTPARAKRVATLLRGHELEDDT